LAECARLAVAYAESAAVRQASQAKRRFGYVTVLAIGAVVTGIASAACALTALWIGLLPFFGPVGAPSIVAGILGGVCLCLVGLMRRRRRPDAVPKPPDGQSAIPLLIGGLLAGLAMGSAPKS
jgi:hypothetical protein